MKTVDIVFTSEPDLILRFVEVEDMKGKSISLGEWITREDGYEVLRILVADEDHLNISLDWLSKMVWRGIEKIVRLREELKTAKGLLERANVIIRKQSDERRDAEFAREREVFNAGFRANSTCCNQGTVRLPDREEEWQRYIRRI